MAWWRNETHCAVGNAGLTHFKAPRWPARCIAGILTGSLAETAAVLRPSRLAGERDRGRLAEQYSQPDGIVYFADYWARNARKKASGKPTADHIDLWNGSRLTATGMSFFPTMGRRLGLDSLGADTSWGYSDVGARPRFCSGRSNDPPGHSACHRHGLRTTGRRKPGSGRGREPVALCAVLRLRCGLLLPDRCVRGMSA